MELIATWDEKPAYRRLALSPLNRLVRNTMLLISFVFLLIQIMYLSFYIVALARLTRVEELLEQTLGYPAWAVTLLALV